MLAVLTTSTWKPQVVVDAPNLWQLHVPAPALAEVKRLFDAALLPRLVDDNLIEEIGKRLIACELIDGQEHGNYFVMRGGSSTNEELFDSSDLSWISVDDEDTFDRFAAIFDEMGIAEQLAPVIDLDHSVRLYSCFFVIRSRCSQPNMHTDWPQSVGTNAFTLLTPLEDYQTDNFQLLYEDSFGDVHQYRYRAGEAICFGSDFVHSTQPGRSLDGRPHAFLCFTFGSDKQEHWPAIAPTINGYQSRFLHRYDGVSELTQIGEYLRDEGARDVAPDMDMATRA